MEEIGRKLSVQLVEEVAATKEVSKFELLTLKLRPHRHEVEAEVALFDDAGRVVGGARWIQLNPVPPESPNADPVDNWPAILETKLGDLNEVVRQRLKELM